MKANIPKEQEDAIYDYIFIGLMIEVLEKKIIKADVPGKEGFKNFLESKIKEVRSERVRLGKYFKDNGIKVTDLVEMDDMFVRYEYFVKNPSGGYKEGSQMIWKAALKMKLANRLNELLNFYDGR